ncbi:hypothetical protein [Streptosporangium amethystogenes]|nr:hypothetical protein [Streptosporangium amethystogenes]
MRLSLALGAQTSIAPARVAHGVAVELGVSGARLFEEGGQYDSHPVPSRP